MTRTDADALARLLEGDLAVNGEATDEARALAALAQALEASAVQPRAEFRDSLRAELVAEARDRRATVPLLTRMRDGIDQATARWRYSVRVATASAAATLVLSGSGVAVAADRAMPGDLLYGLKISLENTAGAFSRGDVARGERLLQRADERVAEAQQVADAGRAEHAEAPLRHADQHARDGAQYLLRAFQEHGEPPLLERLSAFTASQRERLDLLVPLLDGPALQAARDYTTTLDRIDARVALFAQGCLACEQPQGEFPPLAQGRGLDDLSPLGWLDLTYIPPASEPFILCPCPPLTQPIVPGTPSVEDVLEGGPAPQPPGGVDREDPRRAPGPGQPSDPPGDDDDRVTPPLPGPLEEPGDVVEDIIRRIIDPLPDPPADPADPAEESIGGPVSAEPQADTGLPDEPEVPDLP